MPAQLPTILQAVTVPRGQYLLKNETQIRSLALPQNTQDPIVAKHLQFLLWLEDAIDIHEIAETRHRNNGSPRVAEVHQDHVAKLNQIKLHHLDQLAHLII